MPKSNHNKKTQHRKSNEIAFFKKADLLHDWMRFHNKFPAAKSSVEGMKTVEHAIGTFLSAQRRYFKGYKKTNRPLVTLNQERFLYLKRIHPSIFEVYKNRPKTFLPVLVEDEWSYVFQNFQKMDKKRGINKHDYCFSFASKRPYLGEKSSSYKEHMIRSFDIAFSPVTCSPTAPVGTMQNLCSYMFISSRPNCQPIFMRENKASPRKVVLHNQQVIDNYHHVYSSNYFPPNTVPSDIHIMTEIAVCSKHQSIYIHTAHDDEMFHHGLNFGNNGHDKKKNRVRIALIFRWLSVKRNFRCDKKDNKCNRYSMVDKYAMEQLSKHHKSMLWWNAIYPEGIKDTFEKLGLNE